MGAIAVASWLPALALYLATILADGDYANDWLTHMPRCVRSAVRVLGRRLADAIEGRPHHGSAWRTLTRMVADVATCGDPTLPSHSPTWLAHAARILAALYDYLQAIGAC